MIWRDKNAGTTQLFFQTVQNKLHYAVYRHKEMSYLERIVALYLDYAELQAERKIPMSLEDWAKRRDGVLEFNGNGLLTGAGKISAE